MGQTVEFITPDLSSLRADIVKYKTSSLSRMKFGFEQFLNYLADQARLKCPVKTGHLQSSITGQISKATQTVIEGKVGSNVEYAPYVEFGTGVYGPSKTPIRPKHKKILAWVSYGARPTTAAGWKQAQKEGRAIFAREVRGMRARPFLVPAVEEGMNKILDFLKRAFQ